MDLVSIIIPVYNTGEHLKNSIESALEQTYPDLEILLIDDHSSDQLTLDLLKKYAQQDQRIKLTLLPENHGVSYARNKAVSECNGKYFIFLDSDDKLSPDCIEKLHEAIVKYETDFVICDVINYALPGTKTSYNPNYMVFPEQDKPSCSTQEFVQNNDLLSIPVMPFGKMFNTQKYKDAGLYFEEGMFAQDQDWTLRIFFQLKSVSFIRYVGFYRLVLDNSACHKMSPLLRYSILKAIKLKYDVLSKFGYLDFYRQRFLDCALDHIYSAAKKIPEHTLSLEFLRKGLKLLQDQGYDLPNEPSYSLVLKYKIKYKCYKLIGNSTQKHLHKTCYNFYRLYLKVLKAND